MDYLQRQLLQVSVGVDAKSDPLLGSAALKTMHHALRCCLPASEKAQPPYPRQPKTVDPIANRPDNYAIIKANPAAPTDCPQTSKPPQRDLALRTLEVSKSESSSGSNPEAWLAGPCTEWNLTPCFPIAAAISPIA
jgi:hypothetical protein